MLTMAQFLDLAIDVPFEEKGRSYGGWDCWGLVYVAYREMFGIALPLYTGEYHSTRRRTELQALIDRSKSDDWRRVEPAMAGDVVVTRLLGRNCHTGLLVSPTHMLHVQEGVQAVVEDTTRPPWRGAGYDRVEGVYRHVLRP